MVQSSRSTVYFHFLKPFSLSDRTRLKAFLVSIFRKEKTPLVELSFVFCSDAYLLKINRQYLNHDYYTDIITFNLSENQKLVRGEVYISIDRVRDNARKEKTTFKEEIHRVMFHGVLHLCGFKDKTPSAKSAMRKAENKYLELFFT